MLDRTSSTRLSVTSEITGGNAIGRLFCGAGQLSDLNIGEAHRSSIPLGLGLFAWND